MTTRRTGGGRRSRSRGTWRWRGTGARALAAGLLAGVLCLPLPMSATPAVGTGLPGAGTPRSPSVRGGEAFRQAAADSAGVVSIAEGPLPIRAEAGLEDLARALAADRRAYAPLPGIGNPLDLLPEPPTVWVVRDLGRVPGGGPGERAEEWAAGFADSRRNLVAVRAGAEGPGRLAALRSTFRHELAHLALTAATGGRAPRWLHEGYAQLVTGDWNWQEAWRLRADLFREGGEVLHNLSLGFAGRETEARAAYLLSYTAVHELWRRGQGRALSSFFAEMRRGAEVDAALRSVYGLSLAQFEEQWARSVKSRYGWLYMLSRASVFWLVLTLAMLALGWKRWRHQKRKWEELRAADAREAERNDRAFGSPDPGEWGGTAPPGGATDPGSGRGGHRPPRPRREPSSPR